MGTIYRILDYKNGRIISNIYSIKAVEAMLKAVSVYSNSFAVVTHNDEFVTADFAELYDGTWEYQPRPREAKHE